MRKDKTRVLCAISRIDNAERHLLFLLNERKGYNKKAIKWDVETTLYEIRNARTLLKNMEATTKTKCEYCKGKGYLFTLNTLRNVFEIQKCDSCKKFPHDFEAGKKYAEDKEATK